FVRQEEKRRFGVGARRRSNTSRTKLESKNETVPRTKTDATSTNQTVADPVVKSSQLNQATPPGGAQPSRNGTRYVSVDVRREVHERDGGRCVFVSASGRRCEARAFVQLDHVIPFARHGGNEVSNLRLLCRAHNRFHARQCFGALHLAAKIAVKRARTSGA
ncbi:MAG TPA: HNH endonuclease signature motif containing protein, partial [Polyangiaceae bacterium]|nr:HNH endonuclease signature motif containing protein [Polyangiaceae bacterium]